jgi:uncharacterized damage-inducible protein DinB
MDELERAADQLLRLIEKLTDEEFELTRDPEAEELCSVQKVLNHVVRAGYAHANYVRVAFSAKGAPPVVPLGTRAESAEQLRAMLAYMAETLEGRWRMSDEEISAVEIKARWGTTYDLEQMLEHAIVHVLRHRRQIERFLGEPKPVV